MSFPVTLLHADPVDCVGLVIHIMLQLHFTVHSMVHSRDAQRYRDIPE